MGYPTDQDFEEARRHREPPSVLRSVDTDELRFALRDVEDELRRAVQKFPPFNSAHEGYAVLLEEVEELWEVVRQKDKSRDRSALRAEAVQVAAMALRFLTDVCHREFRG